MIIKVCGLKRPQDVELAVREGADVLGMISGVPESPRNNSLAQLLELAGRAANCRVAFLRRNSPIKDTLALLAAATPDILHLCGGEDQAFRETVLDAHPDVEIWQTIGIPVDEKISVIHFAAVQKALGDPSVHQVVLDSAARGLPGGTGIAFPAAELLDQLGDDSHRIIVAGGLNPANVVPLLTRHALRGVDVSSGVESAPGEKSPELLKKFILSVRTSGRN